MTTEPFLKESWERKASEETGEGTEDSQISLYFDMQERAQKHKELAPLISELEKWIGEYADSVIRRIQDKRQGKSNDVIESSDRNQKLIHDVLVDAVNQVSRMYHKLKLDNSWRHKIIGLERDDVSAWALTVAKKVLDKKVEI